MLNNVDTVESVKKVLCEGVFNCEGYIIRCYC